MNAEISSQENKLFQLESQQTRYKAINDAFRKWQKKPASLVQSGLSEADMQIVQTWIPKYSYEKAPIESWRLTNLSATIRACKKMIETLTARHTEAEASGGENKVIDFAGGTLIYNYDDDRVQIDFDEKPLPGMINRLKGSGFKWAPSNGVWQRKLTDNAKGDADYILKLGHWTPEAVAEREAAQKAAHEAQRAKYATA